jgi:hypothetical protein
MSAGFHVFDFRAAGLYRQEKTGRCSVSCLSREKEASGSSENACGNLNLGCMVLYILGVVSVFSPDGTVKSPEFVFPVIPANAGIQYFQYVLDAGVRRHDASATFNGFISFNRCKGASTRWAGF